MGAFMEVIKNEMTEHSKRDQQKHSFFKKPLIDRIEKVNVN